MLFHLSRRLRVAGAGRVLSVPGYYGAMLLVIVAISLRVECLALAYIPAGVLVAMLLTAIRNLL